MNSRRFIAILYVVVFAGLGTVAAILFADAREEYQQLKLAEAVNQRRLAEVEAKLAAQEEILRRLKSDPEYVKTVLRKNGYAQPDEFIFRYPE